MPPLPRPFAPAGAPAPPWPYSSPPAPPLPPAVPTPRRLPRPAGAAAADQPGGPAVAAVLTERAGPAGAPVAEQPPAGCAVCPAPRGRVGAVTDQRAPGQVLHGRKHRQALGALHHGLQRRGISRLRRRIGSSAPVQGLHKLVVKRRNLNAKRLKARPWAENAAAMAADTSSAARGQHPRGVGRRGRRRPH